MECGNFSSIWVGVGVWGRPSFDSKRLLLMNWWIVSTQEKKCFGSRILVKRQPSYQTKMQHLLPPSCSAQSIRIWMGWKIQTNKKFKAAKFYIWQGTCTQFIYKISIVHFHMDEPVPLAVILHLLYFCKGINVNDWQPHSTCYIKIS